MGDGEACHWGNPCPRCGMRLFQDEIYQKGNTYIRIIRLDRYEVEFKQTEGDPKGEAEEQVLVKKEFCRLIRGMTRIFPVQKEGPAPKPKG